MGVPDKNYLGFASVEVGTKDLGELIPPADFAPWSDTLKFSNGHDGNLTAKVIQGGAEDCLDANNGSYNLTVECDAWSSGGGQIATIKGACHDITLIGTVTKHGSVVDVDIDNYSDQKHGASYHIYLNLKTLDGSPITWRSLKGCKPIFLNADKQKYECKFYLPWIIGMAWDRFYQFLKIIKVCK